MNSTDRIKALATAAATPSFTSSTTHRKGVPPLEDRVVTVAWGELVYVVTGWLATRIRYEDHQINPRCVAARSKMTEASTPAGTPPCANSLPPPPLPPTVSRTFFRTAPKSKATSGDAANTNEAGGFRLRRARPHWVQGESLFEQEAWQTSSPCPEAPHFPLYPEFPLSRTTIVGPSTPRAHPPSLTDFT